MAIGRRQYGHCPVYVQVMSSRILLIACTSRFFLCFSILLQRREGVCLQVKVRHIQGNLFADPVSIHSFLPFQDDSFPFFLPFIRPLLFFLSFLPFPFFPSLPSLRQPFPTKHIPSSPFRIISSNWTINNLSASTSNAPTRSTLETAQVYRK